MTRTAALALAGVGGVSGRLAVGERFDATVMDVAAPDELFYQLGSPPRARPELLPR